MSVRERESPPLPASFLNELHNTWNSFDCQKRIVITGLALAALASLLLGCALLLLNHKMTGIGSLSRFQIPLAVGLFSFSLSTFAGGAYLCYNSSSSKKNLEKEKKKGDSERPLFQEQRTRLYGIPPASLSSPKEKKRTSPSLLTDLKQPPTPPQTQRREVPSDVPKTKVSKVAPLSYNRFANYDLPVERDPHRAFEYLIGTKFGIENLEEHLKQIYGDHIPHYSKYPLGKYITDKEVRDRYALQTHLLVATNEEIVEQFSMENGKDTFYQGITDIYFCRLCMINRDPQFCIDDPILDADECDLEEMSLSDLRDVKGEEIPSLLEKGLSPLCLTLLTHVQINALLATGVDDETLVYLFPTKMETKDQYTEEVFERVSPEALKPYLSQLSTHQLRLLPVHYFSFPEFPWERIFSSDQELQTLFGTYGGKKTRAILQSLYPQLANTVASHLTPSHLRFFQPKQLLHPKFPWIHFVTQPKIGEALRALGKEDLSLLNQLPISWKELDESELNQLFAHTPSHLEKETRMLLNGLELQIISALAPKLNYWLIILFEEDKYSEKGFPWSDFLDKEYIGSRVRQVAKDHPAILKAPQEAWQVLAKHPNELKDLFADEFGDLTKTLLEELTCADIRRLALAFERGIISEIPQNKLLEAAFPWDLFFQKDVAFYIRQRKDVEIVLASPHIPWELLADKPEFVKELLSTADWEKERLTEKLFVILWPRPFQLMAPALDLNLLEKFSDTQRASIEFPWVDFIVKKGIGKHLLYYPKYLALPNFPWDEFKKGEEIKELFHDDNDCSTKENLKEVFEAIPLERIADLVTSNIVTPSLYQYMGGKRDELLAYLAKNRGKKVN